MQNPSVKGALGSVALHCAWSAGVKAQVLKACSKRLLAVTLRVMTESHFVDSRSAALGLFASCAAGGEAHTWLILPVVICLSQRLSHACLSISFYTAKLRMAH